MNRTQPTILVVDDEPFFLNLYQDLLGEEDWRVESRQNGDEAIQYLEEAHVDVVLTDMVMPGRCGLDVLRAARSLRNPPDVILVTGFASLESAIHALKNGARDYLVKPFNPDELKHQVRTCLDQRQLLAENHQLKKQIQLYQTGQTLSSLIDLDRLLPMALEALQGHLEAAGGCAFLCQEGGYAHLAAVSELHPETAEKLASTLLPSLRGAAGLVRPDPALDAPIAALELDPERLRVFPLGAPDRLKGGLALSGVPVDSIAPLSADLTYLCDQISLGFGNACRYQDAQELMYTDDLTGLYNHRYMEIVLGHEIRRSQRYGLHFSLLFLDLDSFKQINDTYGHLAGSAALQEVGGLLRGCVRDVDTLFRYGGDEFAAILVETDARTAQIVAERIRRTVEEHVYLQDQNTPSRLTTTAGFATFPVDATDQTTLLALADQAMYAGKVKRNVVRGIGDL